MLLSNIVRKQIKGNPESKAASLNDGELLMYSNEGKTVILFKLFYEESDGFSCWFTLKNIRFSISVNVWKHG